ncbi:ribonuclease III [Mycoplasma bradburyae]|uniref:ribonuclease III n=1 Tax=Mycoplasma bradburyae TaxID=2963128 RepID=UPI0023409577|nr:ribonuclease III [Mycoplasma bradburyae]MDC4184238.1 ribonuclease III [Mycoplasma bradburyae]
MDNKQRNTTKNNRNSKKINNSNKKTVVQKEDKPVARNYGSRSLSSGYLHQLGVTRKKHTEKPIAINDPDYELKMREQKAREAKKIRPGSIDNSKKNKNHNKNSKQNKTNQKKNRNNFSASKKNSKTNIKHFNNKNIEEKPSLNTSNIELPSNPSLNMSLILKKSYEVNKNQFGLTSSNPKAQNSNIVDDEIKLSNNSEQLNPTKTIIKQIKLNDSNDVEKTNQPNSFNSNKNRQTKNRNRKNIKPIKIRSNEVVTIIETKNNREILDKLAEDKTVELQLAIDDPINQENNWKNLKPSTKRHKFKKNFRSNLSKNQDQNFDKNPVDSNSGKFDINNLFDFSNKQELLSENTDQKQLVLEENNTNQEIEKNYKKKPFFNKRKRSFQNSNRKIYNKQDRNFINGASSDIVNKVDDNFFGNQQSITEQEIDKITNYIKDNYPIIYDNLKQDDFTDFNKGIDDQDTLFYVKEEPKDIELLLKKCGIITNDKDIYEQALTHNSYSNEMKLNYNYQRLEFLGDAIINKVVAEYLYNLSESNEGEMTKDRIKIIQSKTLIKAATQLELIDYIKVGYGLKTTPLSPKILEDIFESFIGAAFLDQGEYFVKRILNDTIIGYYSKGELVETIDYKSIFQEIIHSTGLNMKIHYEKRFDPESNLYYVNLYAGGIMYGQGVDINTHRAEIRAAKDAISKFHGKLKV